MAGAKARIRAAVSLLLKDPHRLHWRITQGGRRVAGIRFGIEHLFCTVTSSATPTTQEAVTEVRLQSRAWRWRAQ